MIHGYLGGSLKIANGSAVSSRNAAAKEGKKMRKSTDPTDGEQLREADAKASPFSLHSSPPRVVSYSRGVAARPRVFGSFDSSCFV